MSAIKPYTNTLNSNESLYSKFAKTLTNKASFSAYLEPFIQIVKPEWRYNLCSAVVVSKRNENKRIYTLTLKPAKRWLGFKAGQFVMLSVEINGRLLSRTFSISSSPREYAQSGLIQISICEQEKGAVTPWLKTHIERGDFIYLSHAMGDFCLHHQPKKIFIAGGSGFTPIRAMLKESKHEKWLKQAHLFFYLRNMDERCFEEDLLSLEKAGLTVHRFYSDQDGYFSLTHLESALNIKTHQDKACFLETEAYLCGPGQMISSCRETLKQAGLDESQAHFEYFGPAPASAIPSEQDNSLHDEIIQVDYLDSGKQVSFSGNHTRKTLLELAEEQGLKPVSGCRMGICHQCLCKKKQGRVFNTKTQSISDSGPEDIQLCLSIPVGNVALEL